MFMCQQVNTLKRSAVKTKYCKVRIESKIGIHICLFKQNIYYCKLMVNNKYNE